MNDEQLTDLIEKAKDEKVSKRLESIQQFREKYYSYLEKKDSRIKNYHPSMLYREKIEQVKK